MAHGWAKCHALKPCMTWVDEVKAWKTHGIGLPCVKVVGIRCPTPNSNQTKGNGEICSMGREGIKEKKESKEEKKKEMKKTGRGNEGKYEELVCTLTCRFFSYLGYRFLGAIQWPWSLAPTWRLVQNSLRQTVVCFLGTFDT